MSFEEAVREFQRVLNALMQGHPGVGSEDLTRAVDALAVHLGADEIAVVRLWAGILTAYEHRDVAALTALPARLAELRGRLPADFPLREILDPLARTTGFLAQHMTRPRGAAFTVLPPADGRLPDAVHQALQLLATGGPVPAKTINKLRRDAVRLDMTPLERALLFAQIGMISSGNGHPALLTVAVLDFRKAVEHAAAGDPQRPQYLAMLADALLNRAQATSEAAPGPARMVIRMSLRPMAGAQRDAAEGIALLEQARELAGWTGQPHWALVCLRLGLGYRLVGRDADALAAGIDGLRGHMWQVLMQAHTAAAAAAVKWAALDALEVAGWHAADGHADGAAAALEMGRALILHAATETRDVPRQLAEAGFGDLARQWAALPDGLEAKPAELRKAVFRRLVEPRRLLDPPTGKEVRAALTAVDADALVYLVPADEQVGHAVVVPAHGPAMVVELPELTDPPLHAITTPGVRDLGLPEMHGDGEWAWRAAMGPLLDGPFAGREPRLVLIPMGKLGSVAWHAARSGGTYAIERAAISYAPSARMLCRAAAARARIDGPVLIVGDPDTGGAAPELPAAREEARIVHRRFFPQARYLGRAGGAPAGTASGPPDTTGSAPAGPASGPPGGVGSAAEVEAWLADDSETGGVLHLACHGEVRDDQASLLLHGGERLSADRLAGATRNGRRPGLVVLAACRSAVSGRGWDEAFSLAATFLSAGAGSVVAAQWSLPDRATSDVMVLFHEHIAAGRPPADALRKAQLALLDRPVTDWAGLIHFGR